MLHHECFGHWLIKTISPWFARLTKRGVPFNALVLSMVGGALALLSSIIAPGTVYITLVSISGLAVVAVWMSISVSQYMFRRQYLREGYDVKDLVYRTPLYPVVPIVSFCCASHPALVLLLTQRNGLLYTVVFHSLFCVISCIIGRIVRKEKG